MCVIFDEFGDSSEEKVPDDADLKNSLKSQRNSVNKEGMEDDKDETKDTQRPGTSQATQTDVDQSIISEDQQSSQTPLKDTSKGPCTNQPKPL